ncbi:MAG TPA: 3'-5' exonuclease [Firmicutes bacterium]|nr:3'-5' exonuclease [Bacillota bacterium]
MKIEWIKDLKDGAHVHDEFIVASVNKCASDKGKQYLNVVLQDKTGTINAKKWDVTERDLGLIVPGKVLEFDGEINSYKGVLQFKIIYASEVDEKLVNIENFKKVSPIPLDELKAKLDYYLHSFKDKDVELITNTVINHFYDKYITYPAAVKIHHEFGSGILHHSLAMADLADQVAKLYPSVDRDLLVAGALMHDIGKTVEYKDLPIPEVTTEGKLIGHISIMYAEFKNIVDKLNIKSEVPLLLEHMILSHHGKLEFGSPVLPMTREAMLLSMIDLLDSQLMVVDKALKDVKPGEFSERIWSMDNVAFYKPKERK